jgi:hypothetical protein
VTIITLPSPLKVDFPDVNPDEWTEDEPGEAAICGTYEAQDSNVVQNISVSYVSHTVVHTVCGTVVRVTHACASVSHIKKV